MYLNEIRPPVQPPVPTVQSPSPGATATNTGKATEDPRLVWGGGGAHRRGADFSMADRALIRYVTGEDVDTISDTDLSPFATCILHDRTSGTLPAGHEIDLAYLARSARRHAHHGPANPFCGANLARATDYLTRKADGRVDYVL